MTRITSRLMILLGVSLCLAATPALAREPGGLSFNLQLSAPPAVVMVPGTPVSMAPAVPYPYYVYDGHYYLFVNGQWYVAPSYNGPWIRIAVHRLPGPIRAAHGYHGRHRDWHRWH
jgi:hypothetical protein